MSCNPCQNGYRDEKLTLVESLLRRIVNTLHLSPNSDEVYKCQREAAKALKAFEEKWNGYKCQHEGGASREAIAEALADAESEEVAVKRGPGRPKKQQ